MPVAQNRFFAIAISGIFALGSAIIADNARAASFKIVYTFQGGTDGEVPIAPLVNINGTLYGVTTYGGGCIFNAPNGCGTVFSVTPSGAETVLYTFQGKKDGYYPFGIVNAQGRLIVAAEQSDSDTEISLVTTDGKFKILSNVRFADWSPDRHPLTRVGHTWYGLSTGSLGCHPSCGYIYAVTP
jgi:uncharacterized repeat protein (TIGR03803 family)